MRTIDRVVKEDARKLNLDGTEAGVVVFGANFTKDLRAYASNNTVVSFDVKLDNLKPSSIQLSLACDTHCGASVELADEFQQALGAGWQNITVDLACFQLTSEQVSKIQSPFLLTAKAEMTLSLSNIFWLPQYHEQADISCH